MFSLPSVVSTTIGSNVAAAPRLPCHDGSHCQERSIERRVQANATHQESSTTHMILDPFYRGTKSASMCLERSEPLLSLLLEQSSSAVKSREERETQQGAGQLRARALFVVSVGSADHPDTPMRRPTVQGTNNYSYTAQYNKGYRGTTRTD